MKQLSNLSIFRFSLIGLFGVFVTNFGFPSLYSNSLTIASDLIVEGKLELDGYAVSLAVDNIAALRALDASEFETGKTVHTNGYYFNGDGAGTCYVWDADSADLDNNGSIIKPTTINTGRWRAVFAGIVKAEQFGTKTDGSDASVGINAAISYLQSAGGGVLQLGAGTYRIDNPIQIQDVSHAPITIRGLGAHRLSGVSDGTVIDSKVNDGATPAIYFAGFTSTNFPLAMSSRQVLPQISTQLGGSLDSSYRYATGASDPLWKSEKTDYRPRITLEGFKLRGDAYPNQGTFSSNADGIFLQYAHYSTLKDLVIEGFSGVGVILHHALNCKVDHCEMVSCGVGIRGYAANGTRVFNCYLHYNFVGAQNIVPYQSIIEANGHFGILWDTGKAGVKLNISNYFEAQNFKGEIIGGADIRMLDDSYGNISLTGSSFQSKRDKTHHFFGRANQFSCYGMMQIFKTAYDANYPHFKFTNTVELYDPFGSIVDNNFVVITVDHGSLTVNPFPVLSMKQDYAAVDALSSTLVVGQRSLVRVTASNGPQSVTFIDQTENLSSSIAKGSLIALLFNTNDVTLQRDSGNLRWNGASIIKPKIGDVLVFQYMESGTGISYRLISDSVHATDDIADLSQTISVIPQQTEVQAISDKVDELLGALRKTNILR